MLAVIEGTKKPKVNNKYDLYYKAFCNLLNTHKKTEQDLKAIVKKLVFLGVKAINSKPKYITREELEHELQFIEIIKVFMSSLTLGEFINLFPITKDFRGHKWQTKDYFHAREYISTQPLSEPIGSNLDNLLWEYVNYDLTEFTIKQLCLLSDLRRLNGNPGLLEEWAKMNGIKTYIMHKDTKGKQFLHDPETGKRMRLRPVKPKYLKLIKQN